MKSMKQRGLCSLLLGFYFIIAPCLAEPVAEERKRVRTRESISSPDALKPPRRIPLEESLPSLVTVGSELKILELDLRQAMEMTLHTNPSLERIRSKIRQAEYQVEEAYTLVNPTANFEAQYSRIEPPVSITGGVVINPADNYQFSLVLRQAIYTFGRLKWNVLANKLSKRMVEEEYRAEINRLIVLVAQTYINALLAQEQVRIAEDNFEAQLASLQTSKLLYEEGVSAKFDVLRNSAAASQAQQELIEAQTSDRVARATLLSLLDKGLNRKLHLSPIELREIDPDLDLQKSKETALDTRPDLRSLRWAAEAAKARIRVAKSSNNPTLELQNTTINRNATGFAPGTQNTTALVLSIPLYDGGVTRVQTLQAEESYNQLVSDLEQAERDVVLQVDQIYQQMQDQQRAIVVAEEGVEQAEEALRVAVLRYENGISTNVELLDSQAARSQAQFGLARAKGDYLLKRWEWWQVVASEYPTEVPLPEEMRARLEQEGVPSQDHDFLRRRPEWKLGPLLPLEAAPAQPIRGLESKSPQKASD